MGINDAMRRLIQLLMIPFSFLFFFSFVKRKILISQNKRWNANEEENLKIVSKDILECFFACVHESKKSNAKKKEKLRKIK